MPRVITYSEIRDWQTCGRLWWYKFMAGKKGMGVRSTKLYMPFVEGRAFHHTKEIFLRTGQMQKVNFRKWAEREILKFSTTQEEVDKYWRRMGITFGALLGYRIKYPDDPKLDWVALEKVFSFPLGGYEIYGRLDGVYSVENDAYILQETKFLSEAFARKAISIPMSIQRWFYIQGVLALFGKLPIYSEWDITFKSQIRPRQGESEDAFIARCCKVYQDPKKDMFLRQRDSVEGRSLNFCLNEMVIPTINIMLSTKPDMREQSCVTIFGVCPFLPACHLYMRGAGQGWDAAECSGLYASKDVRHPELARQEEEVTSEEPPETPKPTPQESYVHSLVLPEGGIHGPETNKKEISKKPKITAKAKAPRTRKAPVPKSGARPTTRQKRPDGHRGPKGRKK